MAEQEQTTQHTEGSPWFWKIFGGAIMGLISILLLGHITNINSNVDRTFLDLRGDIKDLRNYIETQRERLLVLEQGAYKEKITNLEKSISALQSALEENKQKMATCEANNLSLKEDIKILRDWDKEMSKQIQDIREKMAANKK